MNSATTGDKPYPIRRCTIIFVILITLTLISWVIARMGFSGLNIALLVLALALIKGALIGDYYMGLRGISSLWRWTIIIWLMVPGILISLAFVSAA